MLTATEDASRYTAGMSRGVLLILFLIPSVVLGQAASNSVTVTASRTTSVPADQIVFGVTVNSGLDKGLDDILNALSSSGITASNFTGISTGPVPQPGFVPQSALRWLFQLPVAISKVKDTTSTLAALQQSLAKAGGGLTLDFSLQGTQVSAQAQSAQTCNLAELVADARAQAQKLAAPAGFTPGAILAVASTTGPAAAACSLTVRFLLNPMFAHTDPRTITIAALRTGTFQPDQALFSLSLTSGSNASLDDATAALAGLGITGATFISVSTSQIQFAGAVSQSSLQWSFTLTAAFSKLKDTFALLTAAQQALAKQNAGMQLAFSVAGTQVSSQAQQSQSCPEADLFADAKTAARNVATAVNGAVGGILNMSAGNSAIPGFVRSGDFTATAGPISGLLIAPVPASLGYSCSLSVQFQLLPN